MTNEEKTSKANKHIGTNKSKRKIKRPRKRRAQRLAMSDAPKDGNVCILSDHVGMGWHRHRCGGYVCRIMYVLLVKASQVAGGINHRFQF